MRQQYLTEENLSGLRGELATAQANSEQSQAIAAEAQAAANRAQENVTTVQTSVSEWNKMSKQYLTETQLAETQSGLVRQITAAQKAANKAQSNTENLQRSFDQHTDAYKQHKTDTQERRTEIRGRLGALELKQRQTDTSRMENRLQTLEQSSASLSDSQRKLESDVRVINSYIETDKIDDKRLRARIEQNVRVHNQNTQRIQNLIRRE